MTVNTDTADVTYADLCRLYWESEGGWITRPRKDAAEIGRLYALWSREEMLLPSEERSRFRLHIIYDGLTDTVRLSGYPDKGGEGFNLLMKERDGYPLPIGWTDPAVDITGRVCRYAQKMDIRETDRIPRATVQAVDDAAAFLATL